MTSTRKIRLRRKDWQLSAGKRCRIYSAGCYSCEEHRRLLEQGRFSYNLDDFWEFALKHDPDGPNIPWHELEKLNDQSRCDQDAHAPVCQNRKSILA